MGPFVLERAREAPPEVIVVPPGETPVPVEAEVAPRSAPPAPPPPPPPPAVAWVIDLPDLDRAERLAHRVERWTGVPARRLGTRWCVSFPEPPPPDLHRRASRRQGAPVEERRDCDVAWFPLGHGFLAALVEPPAIDVEAVVDELHLAFQEVRRSSDPADPVRVCAPLAAVGEPWTFAEHLAARGLVVRAMYDVGSCAR